MSDQKAEAPGPAAEATTAPDAAIPSPSPAAAAATAGTTTSPGANAQTKSAAAAAPVPTTVYGTAAALQELERQELEATRALSRATLALRSQRDLSGAYGFDREATRVALALETQCRTLQDRLTDLSFAKQRLRMQATARLPASTAPTGLFGTAPMLGGGSVGLAPAMMGDATTMLGNATMAMGSTLDPIMAGTPAAPVPAAGNPLGSTAPSFRGDGLAIGSADTFATWTKVNALRQMEAEQASTARMRGQLYAREQQLQQSRAQLMRQLQQDAVRNQQLVWQTQQKVRMLEQQERFAAMRDQQSRAVLVQVSRQAFEAQRQARMLQFQARVEAQRAMIARQQAAATASFGPQQLMQLNGGMAAGGMGMTDVMTGIGMPGTQGMLMPTQQQQDRWGALRTTPAVGGTMGLTGSTMGTMGSTMGVNAFGASQTFGMY